jgi:hypothetical protein
MKLSAIWEIRGIKMKTKFLILLLALFGAESVVANEAIKCYETAWGHPKEGGLGLTAGQAVELCSGTTNANEIIQCYVKAWGNKANGGLGLTAGQAVRLCKRNALSSGL